MQRGGKKLRPRLCALVYAACGGTANIDGILEAVECFHKASLIHDDIQDGDEERYGGATVWKAHGVPLAIAVGDWLVAHGYKLITQSGCERVREMLCAAVTSHQALCEGQGDELALKATPSVEQAISIYERKTGEAFALAAELGALAAGAAAEQCAAARRFGLAYGVAFQIQDDLADGGHLLLDALSGDTSRLVALRNEFQQKAEHENETSLHCDLSSLGLR